MRRCFTKDAPVDVMAEQLWRGYVEKQRAGVNMGELHNYLVGAYGQAPTAKCDNEFIMVHQVDCVGATVFTMQNQLLIQI